ncbi:unnamed protein product [Heligmosomoides polygyrus]|uniref:AAA_12 domain-containing protein n=1 Tax=Heligmosomoides polygyrus TaxID=6339 RepID=A0A183GDU4_HELPZ|nr:unnamed protein product [Heligmosomoides polygyrus]
MVCTTLVGRLLARGIAASSICTITFYDHRRLEARDTGVDLSTVDAIQGREKNVVVLLTTRTDFRM